MSPVAATLADKKIVILISVFARGGAERQALLLARELRDRHRLNAEVWALMFDGDYLTEFEAAGVPTRVLGFRKPTNPLQWFRRLARVSGQLREGQIDVLLPFTAWPNVVAGLTYRAAGIETCIWGERHAGGERIPLLERIAAARYRQFAANSTAGVRFLADVMRIPPERIALTPNGVDTPRTQGRTDWRRRLELGDQQRLVAMVANITHLKDHATLLRAWRKVIDAWNGEPPVLALAGLKGDRYPQCLSLVEASGLSDSVRFLDSIPDVPDLLAASDLAVFSSLNEGMPNGVLECMAAGLTVLASDLPGVRDALGPDRSDCLVPPGDADALAAGLLELLLDDAKRDQIGRANLSRIRDELSVARMAERHLQIIIENSPARFRSQGPLVTAPTS